MADDWKALAESLTPEALILRLKSTEHDFVERKPRGQKGEWLQTAAAFANSAPIGWPAILFVGVDDAGHPQQQKDKIPDLLNAVSAVLDQAYPPIYRHIVPLDLPDEGSCLAVVIPGSPVRPHFAGKAYVRLGDSTKEASEEQFGHLIVHRISKVYEIKKHIGETVNRTQFAYLRGNLTMITNEAATLVACNAQFITIDSGVRKESLPLAWIELSYDHATGRLAICTLAEGGEV